MGENSSGAGLEVNLINGASIASDSQRRRLVRADSIRQDGGGRQIHRSAGRQCDGTGSTKRFFFLCPTTPLARAA
jgi:hypothetical protein